LIVLVNLPNFRSRKIQSKNTIDFSKDDFGSLRRALDIVKVKLHADLLEKFNFLGHHSENLFPSVFLAVYLAWYLRFLKNEELVAFGFIFYQLFATNYGNIPFVLAFLHS
jgi:hypothetical protein